MNSSFDLGHPSLNYMQRSTQAFDTNAVCPNIAAAHQAFEPDVLVFNLPKQPLILIFPHPIPILVPLGRSESSQTHYIFDL